MEQTIKGLLLAKAEANYGVDPVPTAAANAVATVRNEITYDFTPERVPREILNGSWERSGGLHVLPMAKLSFKTMLRGNYTNGATDTDITSGAAAQAIDIDALLQACGLTATYTAESTNGARDGYVTYTLNEPTAEGPGVTFYLYTGDRVHKILGATGTVKLNAVAGRPGELSWEFQGIHVAVADASIPGSITFLETKPPLVGGASALTVASWTPVLSTYGLDLANKITRRDDINSTNGIKGFLITGREPKVTIDPDAVAEATHPIWGDLETPTNRTIAHTIGSVGGNKILITAKGESEAVGYGDRNGVRINTITYDLCRPTISTAAGGLLTIKFF